MAYVPASLRRIVRERARFYCEYCQNQELVTGGVFHVEHIFPEKLGGKTESNNLAWSCVRCNLNKGTRTRFRDPVSERIVPLFNPRKQSWSRHFRWNSDGTRILGRTRSGRATVIALNMNHPAIVLSRAIWVKMGIHPFSD
ncbi:MAG TPA: HNH endonuclease [Anaerolineae bacterium]|nr:HNH endonuclease [Anaerolineae bacterium]